MGIKKGHTLKFDKRINIISYANVVGKFEGDGPMAKYFDMIVNDEYFGEKTYEKAETKLQKTALDLALQKSLLKKTQLDLIASGDLLNQCMSSCYSVRDIGVPYVGLFGACSTMTLSTIVASLSIESGFSEYAAGITSSHFCTAERQFRQPLEYGGQRTPSAQRTVTAGASVIVGTQQSKVYVDSITIGSVIDYLVSDANNMGAAMAPDDVKIRPYPTNEGMVFFYTQIQYLRGFRALLKDFLSTKKQKTLGRKFHTICANFSYDNGGKNEIFKVFRKNIWIQQTHIS